MDAFIRNNVPLVLSSLYLLASLAFAGYALLYVPKQAGIADLRIAQQVVAKETVTLKKSLQAFKQEKKKVENRINSIPAFLRRINELANANQVIIRKLVPDEFDKLKFNLEMFSDYYTFIRFASSLENLNVTIHDLEVRPYNNTKTPPIHFIKFAITPTDDAAPLSFERAIWLVKRVQQKDKRNPFQRFAARKGRVTACIDQTWVYRLSGIGVINSKAVATISNVDYKVGDRVADMMIKAIKSDRVELQRQTKEGNECHILKFRQKKKKRARTSRRP